MPEATVEILVHRAVNARYGEILKGQEVHAGNDGVTVNGSREHPYTDDWGFEEAMAEFERWCERGVSKWRRKPDTTSAPESEPEPELEPEPEPEPEPEDGDASEEFPMEESEEDELEALKQRAKDAGIAHWWTKNADTLREELAEEE